MKPSFAAGVIENWQRSEIRCVADLIVIARNDTHLVIREAEFGRLAVRGSFCTIQQEQKPHDSGLRLDGSNGVGKESISYRFALKQ